LQKNGDSGIRPNVAEPEKDSVVKSPDSLTHPVQHKTDSQLQNSEVTTVSFSVPSSSVFTTYVTFNAACPDLLTGWLHKPLTRNT
jgi:hypothetical protein